MVIELLDTLRCTEEHEQVPLVTAITTREDRFILDGMSGCPVCRREYPIVGGVAWFSTAQETALTGVAASPRDPEAALRLGALLSATEGSTVALAGEWARYAFELAQIVELRVFAVNPRTAMGESEKVGVVQSGRRLPFADASIRGIAIGEPGWSDGDLERATRVLSPGGRMIAPAATAVPSEIEEIARDERVWVGERRASPVALHLVTLHRR